MQGEARRVATIATLRRAFPDSRGERRNLPEKRGRKSRFPNCEVLAGRVRLPAVTFANCQGRGEKTFPILKADSPCTETTNWPSRWACC